MFGLNYSEFHYEILIFRDNSAKKKDVHQNLDSLSVCNNIVSNVSKEFIFFDSLTFNFKALDCLVISREIIPLAELYPPYKKVLYRYQWSPGAVCSCLRHMRPFIVYQSEKEIFLGGAFNAARCLISGTLLIFV